MCSMYLMLQHVILWLSKHWVIVTACALGQSARVVLSQWVKWCLGLHCEMSHFFTYISDRSLPPSQICGPPKCSDFSDCISCMFQIEDGALIRQDQDACFFLCLDINVTMTTDSSLVTSLQVDNGTRQCSGYRTSQRCEGPVYYVKGKGKRVYVVDGSQSKWNTRCVRMQEYERA